MVVVPKNPQACLGGLPDELLLNITGRLSNDALAKLCRTNKLYRGIAEAELYACVLEDACYAELKALMGNPRLCKLIRKISDSFPNDDDDVDDDHDEIWQLILKNATKIKEMEVYDYEQLLCGKGFIEHCTFTRLLHASMRTPLPPDTNTFAHLEILKLTLNNLEIRHIAPAFSLPSVHTLVLGNLIGRETNQPWPLAESTSNIRSLTLDSCILDTRIVVQMLKSVKKLRYFHYRVVYCRWLYICPGDDTPLPHIIWADLAAGLRYHAESLTFLGLYEAARVVEHWGPKDRKESFLGSLSDFTVLKTLRVQAESILNLYNGDSDLAGKLPSGLETLYFTWPLRSEHMYSCRVALESLQAGALLPSTEEIEGVVVISEDFNASVAQFGLASAFEGLEQMGVSAVLWASGPDSWINLETEIFRLEDLRAIEEKAREAGRQIDS